MNGTFKIAALAALLTSAAAFANEDPSQTQQPAQTTPSEEATTPADSSMATDTAWPEFTTLDANGDGSVSQEEIRSNAALSAKFADLDADKNGSLSADEYQKGRDMGSEAPQQ